MAGLGSRMANLGPYPGSGVGVRNTGYLDLSGWDVPRAGYRPSGVPRHQGRTHIWWGSRPVGLCEAIGVVTQVPGLHMARWILGHMQRGRVPLLPGL